MLLFSAENCFQNFVIQYSHIKNHAGLLYGESNFLKMTLSQQTFWHFQALAELQLDGQSNFGFQPDDWNCDSVSRYTASTEIADEKDNNKSNNYNNNNGNNSPTKNNNDNGAIAKTKTEKPKKKKNGNIQQVTDDNTKPEDKGQTSMIIDSTSDYQPGCR